MIFMQDALPLQRVERSAQALAVWRQYTSQKPTLLLLSNDPLLQPVPESVRDQVTTLIGKGTQDEIERQGSMRAADTLFSAGMTLDVALRSKLFSRVVWVLPVDDEAQVVDAVTLQQQLQKTNLVSGEEASSLVQQSDTVAGVLRDIPVVISSLQQIEGIDGPVVIHIDQSYFEKLYKNEIKTPLLSLLYTTLRKIQGKQLPTLAVTFAYGNLERRIALQARFIGDMLDRLIAKPEGLDLPVPPNWQRQVNIFHLGSLIQKDKIRETALAMEKEVPNKAWVQYALYRVAQQQMKGDAALKYLEEAVRLDTVYALEYESLAEVAYDKGRPDAAMTMLNLAVQAFPEEPFLKLKTAQLANELGELETARRLIEELEKLPWSAVYYQDMPEYLSDFKDSLKTD